MVTGKYHMGSLIAIFLALGIGILIGGTLGQQWMFQTEQHTVAVLMGKYEKQMKDNQQLQKNINSLQLLIIDLQSKFKEELDEPTGVTATSPIDIDHHSGVE